MGPYTRKMMFSHKAISFILHPLVCLYHSGDEFYQGTKIAERKKKEMLTVVCSVLIVSRSSHSCERVERPEEYLNISFSRIVET